MTAGGQGSGAERIVTAAVVVIGDEVLSGRTQDINTIYLARGLDALGIRLAEVRVVHDDRDAIAEAVNALRSKCDYVFTTGGIGPTHDDITAESVAHALGRALVVDPEALDRLRRHYPEGRLNAARRRMAMVPEGAALIENPVSAAPGFQVENVFVMAGVPRIMQAMFDGIRHRLVGGAPLIARTIQTGLPEGDLAERLAALQADSPSVAIGSYPRMTETGPGVRLVLRSTDRVALDAAAARLLDIIAALGGDAEELTPGT